MRTLMRLLLWLATGLASLSADIATKAAPHSFVVYNYSRTPAVVYVLVAVFLCVLALWHSNLIAVGAGLMFGGLCGNAGQLMLLGYATDWLPVGTWLTNLADVSGAAGLICCCTGYALSLAGRRRAMAGPDAG